jgi:hypothetical protein
MLLATYTIQQHSLNPKRGTTANSSREITCFTLNCFYFLVFFRIGQIEPPVNSPGGNGLKDEGK